MGARTDRRPVREADVRGIVRRVLERVAAARRSPELASVAGTGDDAATPQESPRSSGRELVSAGCLSATPDGGEFEVPAGAAVTLLAREEAARRGIRFVPLSVSGRPSREARTVAVGSDHGGFALKAEVLLWLRDLGIAAVDFGTRDDSAVDYPDYARPVAEAVASGQCTFGICVDGAGIGSAMAANKVPGVRAANCNTVALAKNAREHNYANVLTLGSGAVSASEAYEIVRAFLATDEGAERHRRRVAKITEIERRYSKTRPAQRS